MRCNKCGNEFVNENNICPFCGTNNSGNLNTNQNIELIPELGIDYLNLGLKNTDESVFNKESETINQSNLNVQTENNDFNSNLSQNDILTNTNLDDESQNVYNSSSEKSKIQINSNLVLKILAIIFIICMIIIVILCFNSNLFGNKTPILDDETNTSFEQPIESTSSIYELVSYVGTYKNDDNTINIYLDDYKSGIVMVDYSIDNTMGGNVYLELKNNKLISYDGKKFEIEKLQDGIKVNTSSDETLSGTYKKEVYEDNWSGAYKTDKIEILISQMSNDYVEIKIISKNRTVSVFAQINQNKLEHEGEIFDYKFNIEIEKTKDGIKVKSSSENDEDILNEASGEYKLVK